MTSRSRNTVSGIIIVIVGVAIAWAAYVYGQHSVASLSAPMPPVTAATSKATDAGAAPTASGKPAAQVQQWTAYTDPEFGFTIHYPATWGTPVAKLVSGRTVIRFSEGFSVDIGQLPGANGQPTSYDELYASSKAESIANHSPMMDTDIGGRPGFILTSVSQATGGIVEVFAYTSYSDEDADIFRASYDLTPARNLTQADVDLFKRVVSTITFGN